MHAPDATNMGRSPSDPTSPPEFLSERVPTEIILMIIEGGDLSFPDLAALALTCRRLNRITEKGLYTKAARIDPDHYKKHSPPNGQRFASRSARRPPMLRPIMIWAAYNNRVGTMDKLIRRGANVNVFGRLKDVKGAGYPIHYAALAGNDKAVKFIVDHGALLDVPSRRGLCDCREDHQLSINNWGYVRPAGRHQEKGLTALHMALCHGHTSTAELLIRGGSSYRTIQPVTPLRLQPLMLWEPDDTTGAIHTAAAHGQHSLIPLMIQQAAEKRGDWATYLEPLGSGDLLNQRHKWGYPLHWAAASNSSNRETLTALVNLGARINQEYRYPLNFEYLHTPLSLAVREGNWEAAMTLLDLGAAVDKGVSCPTDAWETERLRRATMTSEDLSRGTIYFPFPDRPRSASVMLQAITCGPRPAPKGFELFFEHLRAWGKGREDLIRRLVVREGINLSHYFTVDSEYHTTPLIFCITHADNPDVAKCLIPLLLELGADVTQKDCDGNTALHHLVGTLLGTMKDWTHWASIHPPGFGGLGPETARACLVVLLDKGASTKVQNKDGLSPLDVALKCVQETASPGQDYSSDCRRAVAAEVLQILLAFPDNTGIQVDTRLHRLIKKLVKMLVKDVASRQPHLAVVRRMMLKGADTRIRDRIEGLRRFPGRFQVDHRHLRPDLDRMWMCS